VPARAEFAYHHVADVWSANLVTTFLRAALAIWRVSLAEMLQYRGEVALWAVWGIVYPAVALAMWNAALDGADSGSELRGFGPSDFAAYFLFVMVAGHFTVAWDAFEMGWLVRTGRLSAALLRPILPIWRSVGDNIAYKTLTLVILIPIWIVFAWITRPNITAGAGQLAIGGVALLLAAVLNYLWGYNIALLAFWTTRTDAISEFWFGGSLVFGGRLAPLALLPGILQVVAYVLPFRWIIWFPAEVLMGRIGTGDAAQGLIWQAAWIAAGVAFFRVMWRAGLKRYAAVGA
jgi:ABC-2 type transport system permease protein